jgi:hypothetical protein
MAAREARRERGTKLPSRAGCPPSGRIRDLPDRYRGRKNGHDGNGHCETGWAGWTGLRGDDPFFAPLLALGPNELRGTAARDATLTESRCPRFSQAAGAGSRAPKRSSSSSCPSCPSCQSSSRSCRYAALARSSGSPCTRYAGRRLRLAGMTLTVIGSYRAPDPTTAPTSLFHDPSSASGCLTASSASRSPEHECAPPAFECSLDRRTRRLPAPGRTP